MPEDNHLRRQLIRYRDLLANLSRRNREIYFRESKGSSLNLTRPPFPRSAFDDGLEMPFAPLRSFQPRFEEILKGTEFDLHEHFQLEELTEKDSALKLNKKLDKIRIADDRHQREYGISGAWILGPFLCWRTSAHAPLADLLISPVFKIPVDIKKNKKQRHFLVVEDESLSINPLLRLCLKQKLGLEIPEGTSFASPKEAIDYLTKALADIKKELRVSDVPLCELPKIPAKQKVVKDENGEVIEKRTIVLEEELSVEDLAIYKSVTSTEFLLIDVVYLDQLNASRTVLINDYESILENPTDHPILNELFNGTPLADDPPIDRSKLRELDSYKERDNYFVVNIDSTQHRAIDRATKSKAIVIQGPPGTGKSQTITNLIAEYLAKGKRVLFVSEKRPALDVVHNRLRSANIDSQAVLIHSSDLDKPDLYRSFLQLADSTPKESDARDRQNAVENLDRIKSDINGYTDALQDIHLPSHLSVADLILMASKADKKLFDPKLLSSFKHLDLIQLERLVSDLNEIQGIVAELEDLDSSPWINRLSSTVKSTLLIHDLKSIHEAISDARAKKLKIKDEISHLIGAEEISNHIEGITGFVRTVKELDSIAPEFAGIWRELSGEPIAKLEGLQAALNQHMSALEGNLNAYQSIKPGSDIKVIEQLEDYYRMQRGFTEWFSGKYWTFRRARKLVCPEWDGTNKQFAGYLEFQKAFEKFQFFSLVIQPSLLAFKEEDINEAKVWSVKAIGVLKSLKSFFMLTKSLTPVLALQAVQSYEGYKKVLRDSSEVCRLLKELQHVVVNAENSWGQLRTFLSMTPSIDETLTAAVEFISGLIDRIDDLIPLDKSDILISKASERNEIPNLRALIFSQLVKTHQSWADSITSSVVLGWTDEVRGRHQANEPPTPQAAGFHGRRGLLVSFGNRVPCAGSRPLSA